MDGEFQFYKMTVVVGVDGGDGCPTREYTPELQI